MEAPKSDFRFDSFLVERSLIERSPLEGEDIFEIDIIPSGFHYISENRFQLNLNVIVTTEKESARIEIVAIGIFSFNEKIEDVRKNDFFCINAPALMFPYVRSYISALSALSGNQAINLPTINMTQYAESLKKDIIEIHPDKD